MLYVYQQRAHGSGYIHEYAQCTPNPINTSRTRWTFHTFSSKWYTIPCSRTIYQTIAARSPGHTLNTITHMDIQHIFHIRSASRPQTYSFASTTKHHNHHQSPVFHHFDSAFTVGIVYLYKVHIFVDNSTVEVVRCWFVKMAKQCRQGVDIFGIGHYTNWSYLYALSIYLYRHFDVGISTYNIYNVQ